MTDPRDGKTYKTIVIEGARVMAENLNYGTMIPVTQDMSDENAAEKYCYDNDEANCDLYGGLYQWNEAADLPLSCNDGYCTAQINDPHQGICPPGWHMPTSSEWGFPIGAYTPSTLGSILKSAGNYWEGGDYETNESGFSALPGGTYGSGAFLFIKEGAFFWEITEHSSNSNMAHSRFLGGSLSSFSRSQAYKNSGNSVRCWED